MLKSMFLPSSGSGIFSPRSGVFSFLLVILLGCSQPASATPAKSQTFPPWTQNANGADITLTADTTTYHSGVQSLKMLNASPASAGNGGFQQAIPVQPSTLYHLSAWVKGSNVSVGATTNCFGVDGLAATLECLPTGTFPWQQITWTYTTGPTETTMFLVLYSTNSGTVWFDDISVTGGSSGTNLVANPGFEVAQDTVTVVSPNPAVIFSSGAFAQVASSAPSITWTATDVNGVQIGSGGPLSTVSANANFALPGANPGWYSLNVTTSSGTSATVPYTLISNGYVYNGNKPNPFGANFHPAGSVPTTVVQAMGDAGLASARLDINWATIELTKGVYTWPADVDSLIGSLNGGGVRSLVVLGYYNPLYDGGNIPSSPTAIAAFAAYAAAAAQHYNGYVDIDVFNEFNVPVPGKTNACGTTALCYYALLVPAANAIHHVANGTRVVGPTLGGFTQDWIGSTPDSYNFLQQFISIGGLNYLDVVDIHNYTYPTPAPPEGNNNAVIAAVQSLLKANGSSLPLWLTETGWPNFPTIYTSLQQAQYVVRDAALSLQAGASQYMFYEMEDDTAEGATLDGYFGLMLNPAGSAGALSPKPGYTAYSVLARTLSGFTYSAADNLGSGLYSLRFVDTNNNILRVAWSPTANTTLAAQSSTSVAVTNWDGSSTTITPVNNIVTFSIGPDPVYIVGSGITATTVSANPPMKATPPATVHANQPVTIAVAINGVATGAPTGSVMFTSAYGSTSVTATSGNTVTGNLVLTGFPAIGLFSVPINVIQGSTVVGRLVVTLNVTQ